MRRNSWAAIAVGGTLWILLGASAAPARRLSSVFSNELKGLEMEPLDPALANNSVAATYPVASASSSVT